MVQPVFVRINVTELMDILGVAIKVKRHEVQNPIQEIRGQMHSYKLTDVNIWLLEL